MGLGLESGTESIYLGESRLGWQVRDFLFLGKSVLGRSLSQASSRNCGVETVRRVFAVITGSDISLTSVTDSLVARWEEG